jgi:hypothetical protein
MLHLIGQSDAKDIQQSANFVGQIHCLLEQGFAGTQQPAECMMLLKQKHLVADTPQRRGGAAMPPMPEPMTIASQWSCFVSVVVLST